ncbi:hypothetical protein Q9299_08065 [Gemmobacter fulvus]|uniref:hypothetical protein n=1 Tax=Gemmobacter fulvus TaxID=2840474 RepID=UPI0027967CDD|nr:hypothetical protein [Gemmobacter fulvus]MDQ1848241.1 hypothetical protein [Gemmobacter fulvus]
MANMIALGQCALRLVLAAVFGAQGLSQVSILVAQAGTPLDPFIGISGSLLVALNAVLVTIAIWLVFGVRTRVVTLIGLTLYLAAMFLHLRASLVAEVAMAEVLAVVLMALPLILLGGGRFALYRAGWKEVL